MITSNLLSKYKELGLIHGISTTKEGPLFDKKENWESVVSNREKFFESLGIEMKNVVFFQQVHGSNVKIVKKEDLGSGVFYPETEIKNSDGGITKEKGIFMAIKTADCMPMIGFDPIEKIVFAVHIGFKSLIQGIHLKALVKLLSLGSKPENLVIYIGPSIKKESYSFNINDVFQENLDLIDWTDFYLEYKEKVYLDLPGFLERDLLEMGLKEKNLDISPIDTFESKRFFSYKRGNKFERFVSVIGISTDIE